MVVAVAIVQKIIIFSVPFTISKAEHSQRRKAHNPRGVNWDGLRNGFNTATTPLWLCELLPAKRRGRDVSTAGDLIASGIIIAYYFNIGLSYTTGPVQWRLPIAFQGVFIILQLTWTKYLPESPRWLIKHGRHEGATDILAQLQGKDVPCNAPTVIEQKRPIDEVQAGENEGGP
ncbi:hypothetical protein LTR72_010270 [Exophiala xenobiotica]|nr:hypothetical protein LTR72_010270 [Exophiala xenobiotica]KAK5286962.1 hypothetical protein LTR14_009707 [Exophiala xenobiotica]KAK5478167.1 hypothetical protein LTR55_008151 [Exophiala xenobiotica]